MLKHLNALFCLQFKYRKWVLDYLNIEWCCGIKSFLSLSNITLLFSLYDRCPSTILKFLQDFLKLALFSLSFDIFSGQYLLLTKFSIFLKSTHFLLAIILKFIFKKKEMRGFIWHNTFVFFISKTFDFLFRKRTCSLKIAVPKFSIFLKAKFLIIIIMHFQEEKRAYPYIQ